MARASFVALLGGTLGLACLPAVDVVDSLGGADAAAGGTAGNTGGTTSGGSGGRGNGGSSPATLEAAIATYVENLCIKMRDCVPGFLNLVYGSYGTCVSRLTAANEWVVTLPDITEDVAFYERCGAALVARSCSTYFDDLPECETSGTRPNGRPCNAGDQCVSGFCSQKAWECGTCAPMPITGDPCTANSDCGRGQFCSAARTCQNYRLAGEACTTELLCRGELSCANGRCAAPAATLGVACDSDVGLRCDYMKNFSCLADTNSCIARAWAPPGGACSVTRTLHTACAALSTCTEGTCVPGPGDHAACDPTSDYCQWPAQCSPSGTCMLPTDAPACN